MKRKIVVLMPGLEKDLECSIREMADRLGFEAVICQTEEDAQRAVAEAEILLSNVASLCAQAPKLRWMCSSNAGVEPYLRPGAFASQDVMLTNSSGAYGVTIAEHIIMVTLEMMRREAEYRGIVAGHGFRRDLAIRSLYGARVTMLGTGDIGRKTAARLRGFMPAGITGISRSGRPVREMDRVYPVSELDWILPETDLLIMSLPGTPETVHVLNEKRILSLPREAYLVNVGRGSAIDQRALVKCLREGHLAGAALDVFETEPIPPEDPIWDCPRLHITPHCAGNITLTYTRRFIVEMFLRDLENYAAGRPLLAQVDRERGY
ncbi:MAG: D-2-hydroxyacid dehydrogenase [Clostridia bacterium]|nr:D-2-hydroxyacid dehydrogenase [Clostridia bacterium]